MKKFLIRVAQNGGEYYGYTTIKGNTIIQKGYFTVVVDGIEIIFDEYIDKIETKDE